MKRLKTIFACMLMALFSIGQVWGEDVTGTINFGSASGSTNINGASVSGDDSQDNEWTVKTVGTTSFTPNAGYAQVGSSSKPATSITFSMKLGSVQTFSAKNFSAKFGGFSNTAGTIAMKVTNTSTGVTTSVGSGSLNASNDVTVESSSAGTGDSLTITITSISKGVKCYWISYTYSTGGGATPSLSLNPTSKEFDAEDNSAQVIGLTAANFTSAVSNVTCAFYSEAACTTSITRPSWVNEPTVNAGKTQVSVNVEDNDGAARQTWMKITASDGSESASAVFAISQKKYTEPTGTFELFSGDLEEGDYVIYYGGGAMNTTVTSNRLQYESVTPSEDKITNPDVSTIWHIAPVSETSYWTLYNEAEEKYAASTSAKNQATMAEGDLTDNMKWSITGSETYEFENLARSNGNDPNNKWLRKNGTSGFGCYLSTQTGTGPLSLYKKADGRESAGLAYAEADQKKLVKLGDAFTAPNLTNPNNLTVTYASNNTSVAEVAANGAVTIKAVGIAEITASFAGNDDYKPGFAKYTIGVVDHAGSETDHYTVADAKIVIDALGGKENVYVAGTVSTANLNQDNINEYHNATYWISDDGTTANQLEAFHGRYIDNADVTLVSDIMVGDEVVIYGSLTKYNNTYELADGNYLISLTRNKEVAGLIYAEKAIQKNINAAEFTNPLTNPNNLDITYSSSDENLATVDENGEVTVGNEEGTVTITASTNGDATHLSGTATYTLTIVDPSLTKVTFDATQASDIAEDNDEGVTKNGINIKTSHTDGINDQSTAIAYYQTFKYAALTVTSTVGNIKKIEFTTTGGASYTSDGFAGVSNNKWTGDASEVVLTASGHQVRMSKIVVSYVADNREDADLSWSAESVVLTVGETFTAANLVNPNGIAAAEITIESDNTELAQVENGVVSLVADATGTAHITATFDGNDDYKPATVSYTITVNEADLDNVTFDSSSDHAESGETTITKGGFTLNFSAGSMDGTYDEYRLHKSQTMTLSSIDYYIKKIEFTCTSGNPITGFDDAEGLDKANSQWTGQAKSVVLTNTGAQVRITELKVYYIEDSRAVSGLAWSTDEVEITLGETFTPANLVNPNSIDAEDITIASDNTELAQVENGVVSLVENATGTAHITATFDGNDDYKPASVLYTIIVNDPTPMIIVDKSSANFGTVAKDASVEAKTVTVTLQNVAAATATLGGTNSGAFSINKTALVNGDVITISVASTTTETIGEYSATITITDNAGVATQKIVNISLAVEDVETPVNTSSKWVVATEISDGMVVLITSEDEDNGDVYAMGADRGNNRGVVLAKLEENVLTPGEGTMSFTLVAQGDNTYGLLTSNGKYLYAGGTGNSNWLNTKKYSGELDANAKWSIDLSEGTIIAGSENNRNDMRFNKGNSPKIISCYQSSSTYPTMTLYVPQPAPTVHTVTFDKNDGSDADEVEVNEGEKVAKPEDPIREGYTFNYWTLNNTEYDFDTPVNDDITLVADWTENPAPDYGSYNRDQLTIGDYGTICLPKAGTISGAVLFAIGAYEGGMIMIDEIGSNEMIAGRPYIFQAIDNELTVEYSSNDEAVASSHNGLYGSFDKTLLTKDEGNYILYNNLFYYVNSTNVYVGANRAYIKIGMINYTEPAPCRRRVAMSVNGNQMPTEVEGVEINNAPRKVVINGELYILRGEKMYDVRGQLVK